MKQETKDKIKKYGKRAYYIVVALAWVFAFVGALAMSFYWCRQCVENREPQIVERPAIKHSLNDVDVKTYYVSKQSYAYSTDLPYNQLGAINRNLGFYFTCSDTSIRSATLTITFSEDNYIYCENHIYNQMFLTIDYTSQVAYNYHFELNAMTLAYNWSDYLNVYNRDGLNKSINFYCYDKPEVTATHYTNGNFSYVQFVDYALFDYFFTEVVATDSVASVIIDFNVANFTQLLSYARVGVYDFIYSGTNWGSVLEIPMTFIYNNVLYDHILVETDNIVYFIGSDNTRKQYNEITGSDTSYILGATHIAFLKYGGTYDTTYPDGNNSPQYLYPYMIGDITEIAYREVAYYEAYTPSQGSRHMRPVYNMPKGWNTYGNITYDILVSSDSLYDVPFVASSTDVHYPLSNLTIGEILQYVSQYNNDYFDNNGYGVTDVGLSGVFTLISNAFSGLTTLMAINVIPGITIGLLLFLPLVITIIIVVLRLVKK